MSRQLFFPPISLTDARTGKRVRVQALPEGAALVPMPEPILGYSYQQGHLTVYVNGSMPPELRTAHQEGTTAQEVLLVAQLPAGIREIDLTDCRREFRLLLPQAA
ncbi:hypothetical protein ACFPAF_17030 [Hymenobacter endophyticus]|uniref:Uncharacterized protein n=1 Tax=Hymenobacter endophyticus TaxID=3076335 RepID=A0ABU3TL65_9BACT|nr:hypothetical protein [Hymenobacter endophyticus]MDU0372109.1 hypothetical protein [Hymenobacter endophyticus]